MSVKPDVKEFTVYIEDNQMITYHLDKGIIIVDVGVEKIRQIIQGTVSDSIDKLVDTLREIQQEENNEERPERD